MIATIELFRFKYRFGIQPLVFVSNWSLTFQLCQIGILTFQPCVKMIFTVKCWMEKADIANSLFLT
jgi:hypothetical protein